MSAICPADEQLPGLARLERDGYAFVASADMRRVLLAFDRHLDWPSFAASWERLAVDQYLATTGRRRLRRHGVFRCNAVDGLTQQPHRAHYQTVENNQLQGGIERWFEPLEPETAASPTLAGLIRLGNRVFAAHEAGEGETPTWDVEVHQFRIEALSGQLGEPTPEGVHRDGVDWVLVVLIDRVNISSGTTTIHARDGAQLGSFTLTRPLDAALVDDRRCLHGVTPVEAVNPRQPAHRQPAHRDVLVVTYRRVDAASPI